MQLAPIPSFEDERLKALQSLGILNTQPEERFDRLTKAAVEKLNVPISTVSLIDAKREWYKSCQGLNVQEGGRDISFCGHAMLAKAIFIIEDTKNDQRFVDNPSVVGFPSIRFYAGVALRERQSKLPIGVFCVKDTQPRKLTLSEINTLLELAKEAEDELNKSGV